MYAPFSADATEPVVCANWLEQCGVSSHYLIAQSGEIYQLVPEELRAWHAGRSKLPNTERTEVNHFSIGIELLAMPEIGYSEVQLTALENLLLSIFSRWEIKNIFGHKHVAIDRLATSALEQLIPQESQTFTTEQQEEFIKNSKNEAKTDPWNFPWNRLNNFLQNNCQNYAEFCLPEN